MASRLQSMTLIMVLVNSLGRPVKLEQNVRIPKRYCKCEPGEGGGGGVCNLRLLLSFHGTSMHPEQLASPPTYDSLQARCCPLASIFSCRPVKGKIFVRSSEELLEYEAAVAYNVA